MNWRWPATANNLIEPWYVIGWRLLWLPLVMAALGAYIVLYTICYGSRSGREEVRRML